MIVLGVEANSESIDAVVRRALAEDIGTGDVTSLATIDASSSATGRFLAKEEGVISGTVPAERAFEILDPTLHVEWSIHDGAIVSRGQTIGRVSGNARAILTGERTALNLLQRMSGIASLTSKMVDKAAPFGARILDTRKTVPGLRALDKLAVVHGGGLNHRFGLYDMILIKDNHIVASGSIARSLASAAVYRNSHADKALMIEIEARTLDEVGQIMAHWDSHSVPDRILLDNMAVRNRDGNLDVTTLRNAVELIAGRVETEASGNVDLSTVAAIAATGVDFISSGAITHSVRALDISLEFSFEASAGR